MMRSKIGKNALSNIAGMLTQLVIAFMLSPFLVHTLGDSRYGIWTVVVAFTGYMNLLDLGLSSAINRYVARYNGMEDFEKLNSILSTALLIFVFIGISIVAVSPVLANFVASLINVEASSFEIVYLLIIIVSFDIAVVIIRGLFRGAFAGFQRFTVINTVQVGSALYKAVLFYVFLSENHGLISMALISISANVISLLIFYCWLRRAYPFVSFRRRLVNKDSYSKLLHYSKFTFLAMIANQLIYYSDVFIIGYFLSAAAVTHYSIPWTLSEYTKKIVIVISQVFVPAISENHAAGNIQMVRDTFLRGTKYVLIFSNLISVGAIALGGAFISIWMGPKYSDLAEFVLPILFVNQMFLAPQQIGYAVLLGMAKQKNYSIGSAFVSVANLVLSIILVQKYGIVGVAIGAAIPQIMFHLFYVPSLALEQLEMSATEYFRITYLPTIIPTAILFVVLLGTRSIHYPSSYSTLLLQCVVGAAAYLIAVYFIVLNKNEQKAIAAEIRNRAERFSHSWRS